MDHPVSLGRRGLKLSGLIAGPVRAGRAPLALLTLALLAALAGCLGWLASGGSWLVVQSPSMGTAAPVGTLLWVAPTEFGELRAGQLISFHPPTEPGVTYTHRIVQVNDDATVSTRGDLNGTLDPWRLRSGDVTGAVRARWWYAGWLVRALPALVPGGLLLWLVCRRLCAARWRLPVAIAGTGLLVSLALQLTRPLVRAQLISIGQVPGGARARFVDVGILPIRLTGNDGTHTTIGQGKLAELLISRPGAGGRFTARVSAEVGWPWLLIAILVGFAPALYGLLVGLPAGDLSCSARARGRAETYTSGPSHTGPSQT